MQGFEPEFRRLVNALWPTTGAYLEIGLAHGKTFQAVCRLLEYRVGYDYRAFGIDPNPLFDGGTRVITKKSGDALVEIKAHAPYALVLIDGCHCYECAGDDFRRVAPFVMSGGFVLFHDYAPEQQGGGAQAYHDDRPIEVRRAVETLKRSPEFAAHWIEHPEWVGDRTRDNVANMGVFEKR